MVSFPFDSKVQGYDDAGYPIYDRAVDSQVLADVLKQYADNGVFQNQDSFNVTAGEGMLVNVSAGAGVINGITCVEKVQRTLTIQASDTTYDRIDTVVLRLNTDVNVRSIDLYVLEGTPAVTPTVPALTRSGSIYELGIANIFVPVNSVQIDNERITDTRADNARCGWVRGVNETYVDRRFEIYTNEVQSLTTETQQKFAAGVSILSDYYDDIMNKTAGAVVNGSGFIILEVIIYNTGSGTQCTKSVKVPWDTSKYAVDGTQPIGIMAPGTQRSILEDYTNTNGIIIASTNYVEQYLLGQWETLEQSEATTYMPTMACTRIFFWNLFATLHDYDTGAPVSGVALKFDINGSGNDKNKVSLVEPQGSNAFPFSKWIFDMEDEDTALSLYLPNMCFGENIKFKLHKSGKYYWDFYMDDTPPDGKKYVARCYVPVNVPLYNVEYLKEIFKIT